MSASRADPLPASGPGALEHAVRPLEVLTLAISGYGGGRELSRVLLDWFRFLGGRPGEVVYVDGGSPRPTVRQLTAMLCRGLLDRLQLLNPDHPDSTADRCFVQEYESGRLATRPYVLFVKLDTLPFRRGYSQWLAEDLATLERADVLAITTTHLLDEPLGQDGPYLVHDFASLNFCLMKRAVWDAAMRETIGPFAASGFTGAYPAGLCDEPRWRRALIEWAWQRYCRQHGLRTLARAESRDWTIMHVNKSGRKLLEYRRRYLAREGIEAFLNVPHALYRPPLRAWERGGRRLEAGLRALRNGLRGAAGARLRP